MTDAVKMAIEALTDIRTSIECAAGCDEGIDPMAAVSEIMSAYGTAMASAYSWAADIVNILAALEQAGEPVAADGVFISRELFEFLTGEGDIGGLYFGDKDERGRAFWWRSELRKAAEAPLPTLQRLGQEFDAGVAKPVAYRFVHLDYAGRKVSRYGAYPERVNGHDPIETHPLYAHPPQSRGQAFDGEGEAGKILRAISARMTIACDWTKAGKDHIKVRTADWHVLMEIGHQARALSSAKRGEG